MILSRLPRTLRRWLAPPPPPPPPPPDLLPLPADDAELAARVAATIGIHPQADAALAQAVEAGRAGAVPLLVGVGAAVGRDRQALIRRAADRGDVATLTALHHLGGDIRCLDDAPLRGAVAGGHRDLVTYLHRNGVDIAHWRHGAVRLAARGGFLDLLRDLHEAGADLRCERHAALADAAAGGHHAVAEYLLAQGLRPEADGAAAMRAAICAGAGDLIRRFVEMGFDLARFGARALLTAVEAGRADLFEALLSWGAPLADIQIACLHMAIRRGDDRLTERLIALGTRPDSAALERAVVRGDDRLIERLITLGARPDTACLNAACAAPACFERLLSLGAAPDASTLLTAAARGDLALFERLIALGLEIAGTGPALLRAATAGGHLPLVIRLDGLGIDPGAAPDLLPRAAAARALDLVRWLHRRGLDLHTNAGQTLHEAALADCVPILTYLHEQGVALACVGAETITGMAARGALAALDHLQRQGVDLAPHRDAALIAAAGAGQAAMVAFLHRDGADLTRCGPAALAAAAGGGHRAILDALHHQGVDLAGPAGIAALTAAAAAGRLEIIDHLLAQGVGLAEAGGPALTAAARAGHSATILALHRLGASTHLLPPALADSLATMRAYVRGLPAIWQPAAFWEHFGDITARQLDMGGIDSFKRTVNQVYGNFIPVNAQDPQLQALRHGPRPTPARWRIDDPDCRPDAWWSFYPGYRVFHHDPRQQRRLYRWLIARLHARIAAGPAADDLARIAEPELGRPLIVRRDGQLISQDLLVSLAERRTILDGAGDLPPMPRVLELGAGYGRLAYVFLSLAPCRYVIADIPPALLVAQWYLSTLFPDRRIFTWRPFESFAEIADELAAADIAFLTPDQIALLPARFADVTITISSLHEMRPEQIAHHLPLLADRTGQTLYLKQYWSYINTVDGWTLGRDIYTLPAGWTITLERTDTLNPRFFELLARRIDA